MRKATFAAVLAMVAVGALALAGAGSAAHVNAGGSTAAVNLSTPSGVASYVRSLGVNPRGFVVQRGTHNYAGAKCPGAKWNCTTATHVIQLFADTNQFSCTASVGSNNCVVIQVSTGAANNANCVEKVAASSQSQSCQIFQTNTGGSNNASVSQSIMDSTGSTQNDTQYTAINQQNASGSNNASVSQALNEASNVTATGAAATTNQSQDGHQTVSITQHSDTGNNGASVAQSLALKASATGGSTINQTQDNNDGLGPNTSAAIYQNADEDTNAPTSTGRNTGSISQTNDLNGNVAKATNGNQTQGAFGDGLLAHFEQLSQGVSNASESQNEHQTLTYSQIKHLQQTQIGPMWGGSPQQSNPGDTYSISQSSNQNGDPSSMQDDAAYGNCDTSGHCTISERLKNNSQNQTNFCSGTSCHIGLEIISGEGESNGVFPCSGFSDAAINAAAAVSSCPFPPSPPAPVLIGTGTTVVSDSTGGANVGDPVKFTATVAPATAAGPITGTVTFNDGFTTLATVPVSGGSASLTTSALEAGEHTITATYSGNGTYSGSSGSVDQSIVNPLLPTSTSVFDSPAGSSFGEAITFTANVADPSDVGVPTGTVTFTATAGATVIPLGSAPLNVDGQASITSSDANGNALPGSVGGITYTITASYGGDPTYDVSSGTVTHVVSVIG